MNTGDIMGPQLLESDLRLKIAIEAGQIGVWDWDLETDAIDYSARARSIFGFPAEGAVTVDMVRAATHSDDVQRIAALTRRVLDPTIRDRTPYEYRICRADTGETRWVIAHGEATFSDSGPRAKATRFVGTIQDITARKEIESALAESEMRQRLAITAARMALWEVDLATERVSGSVALNRMYGFPDDASPSIAEFRAAYAPGEQERVQHAAQEALARGERQFEVEFRVIRPDGGARWMLLRAEMLFTAEHVPERVIGVLMDIDDRKRNLERQILLARELNHRVKNSLTVVQSLATQTFRGHASHAALDAFRGRLQALSRANNVLLDNEWQAFSLVALLDEVTGPYRSADAQPFTMIGDDVPLPPSLSVPIALAMHELCTNAAKYGALSVPDGHIDVSWRPLEKGVELIWTESGGPQVREPEMLGFGTKLLTNILSRELTSLDIEFRPAGLHCRMVLPVGHAQPLAVV